ncbi:capsid protein [Aerococcaceae bacterium zg-ZUI334]|uniref:putative minor capsid protein n=1 Tax=Aerococcaceae bacterium zg-252 TaxID=2796928 RepID=UPI001BA3EC9E|nr:capsid protein [Aerococcaceae bacterium zg-ZUI334]
MIDKRWLVDSLKVKLLVGRDEWGKESYGEPFDLSPVRFDRSVSVQHYVKNSTRSHQGVIFIYPEHVSIDLDYDWLHAIIIDGQREYKVTGFQINMHPFQPKVFSYELEVV